MGGQVASLDKQVAERFPGLPNLETIIKTYTRGRDTRKTKEKEEHDRLCADAKVVMDDFLTRLESAAESNRSLGDFLVYQIPPTDLKELFTDKTLLTEEFLQGVTKVLYVYLSLLDLTPFVHIIRQVKDETTFGLYVKTDKIKTGQE